MADSPTRPSQASHGKPASADTRYRRLHRARFTITFSLLSILTKIIPAHKPEIKAKVVNDLPRRELSSYQEFITAFIQEKMHKVRIIFRDGDDRLHPLMKSWLDLIDNDPQANMHFTNMFLELPENAKGSLIDQGITDYRWLIRVLDVVAREAPEYINSGPELTSVPISLVLDYFMNTPGGMNAFMYDKINAYIYKTLESWGNYLTTTESAGVLNEGPGGWFSEDAIAMFDKRAGTPFEEMYLCDRSLPHWGFDSWDHFFTRPLRPDARPTDRNSNHIISPCESTTFRLAHDVKATDTFWLKKEIPLFSYPYSLVHMFNHDKKYVKAFEGGTVYQAYLSPFDYHRWHSPVDGRDREG